MTVIYEGITHPDSGRILELKVLFIVIEIKNIECLEVKSRER